MWSSIIFNSFLASDIFPLFDQPRESLPFNTAMMLGANREQVQIWPIRLLYGYQHILWKGQFSRGSNLLLLASLKADLLILFELKLKGKVGKIYFQTIYIIPYRFTSNNYHKGTREVTVLASSQATKTIAFYIQIINDNNYYAFMWMLPVQIIHFWLHFARKILWKNQWAHLC